MADTSTSYLGLTKPEVGVLDPTASWGSKLNDNLDDIDTAIEAINSIIFKKTTVTILSSF